MPETVDPRLDIRVADIIRRTINKFIISKLHDTRQALSVRHVFVTSYVPKVQFSP